MAKQAKTAPPERKVNYLTPPEGMPMYYSNHFQIGNTVFDLRVVFGEVVNVTNDEISIRLGAQVTMTWLQAKALAAGIQAYVDEFEEQNGPIKTEFPMLSSPQMPPIPLIVAPKG